MAIRPKSIPDLSTRTSNLFRRLQSAKSRCQVEIYDVVAENISVVNNYRAQFNRVIAKSSFEELLRIMKQQAS